MGLLFHMLPRAVWDVAKLSDSYAPASLADEGFIHLCYGRQLLPTAERYFAGRLDVIVLSVRHELVKAELREELVHGEVFPHLYGPLNLEAVVEAVELPVLADGSFGVPEASTAARTRARRGTRG